MPSGVSKFLLQDILIDKWNFDGYITSNCGAVNGIFKSLKYVKTTEEAAAVALKAGMNLNCGSTFNFLKKVVEEGLVSEDLIDTITKQLFKTRFKLGMFDATDTNPFSEIGSENITEKNISI
mgnify:CR=1 FL=1